MIVAAVAAGVSGGAGAAVQASLERLYEALRGRFAGRSGAEPLLDGPGGLEPGVWRDLLAAELLASGADGDTDVLAAAHAVLNPGRQPGNTYTVQAPTYGSAMTVGHSITNNNYYYPPAAPGAA